MFVKSHVFWVNGFNMHLICTAHIIKPLVKLILTGSSEKKINSPEVIFLLSPRFICFIGHYTTQMKWLICSGDEYELLADSFIWIKFLIVILMKTLLFRVVYNHKSNSLWKQIPLTTLRKDVLGIHNTCVYKILDIQYITKYSKELLVQQLTDTCTIQMRSGHFILSIEVVW